MTTADFTLAITSAKEVAGVAVGLTSGVGVAVTVVGGSVTVTVGGTGDAAGVKVWLGVLVKGEVFITGDDTQPENASNISRITQITGFITVYQ
ncbi:MAG: hypothetical protein PHR56_01125 [Dehalococcoidales bacterium]|nr:hypothetical protein [Dehalococcoidales bacterium]